MVNHRHNMSTPNLNDNESEVESRHKGRGQNPDTILQCNTQTVENGNTLRTNTQSMPSVIETKNKRYSAIKSLTSLLQKHILWTIWGPDSSYWSLEIHISWNVESEDRMEPPIHTEYFRSGGATTLILMLA